MNKNKKDQIVKTYIIISFIRKWIDGYDNLFSNWLINESESFVLLFY